MCQSSRFAALPTATARSVAVQGNYTREWEPLLAVLEPHQGMDLYAHVARPCQQPPGPAPPHHAWKSPGKRTCRVLQQ